MIIILKENLIENKDNPRLVIQTTQRKTSEIV